MKFTAGFSHQCKQTVSFFNSLSKEFFWKTAFAVTPLFCVLIIFVYLDFGSNFLKLFSYYIVIFIDSTCTEECSLYFKPLQV